METYSLLASNLGTDCIATQPDQVARIKEFLAEPISKLNELQREIDQVKAHYDSLVEKHMELSRYIKQYEALIAPIHRLPVDVLREIFLHCLPTTHNAVISSEECPILLTRICSSWRRISLDTPVLWASIYIPIPGPHHVEAMKTAKTRAKAIKEWLGRSGGCVLDISLHGDQYSNIPTDIHDIILDTLIPFSRRWGSLTCRTPPTSLRRITAIPASDLPHLHTLFLSCAYGDDWAESGVIRAPRLRSITYGDTTQSFAQLPLSWAQLTEIAISGSVPGKENYSVSLIAKLLTACPMLRQFHLDIAFDSERQRHTYGPIERTQMTVVLRHLESLSILANRPDLIQLLDALDAPALEQLDIRLQITPEIFSPLIMLLQRTAHTLHTLTLDPRGLSCADLVACLSACSNLTALSLHSNGFGMTVPIRLELDDDFLWGLLVPYDGENFTVLSLRSFSCTISTKFSDAGVLEVLHARHAADRASVGGFSTLSQVEIHFRRPQKDPMLTAIKDLAEMGVACDFFYFLGTRPTKSLPRDGLSAAPVSIGGRNRVVPPTF